MIVFIKLKKQNMCYPEETYFWWESLVWTSKSSDISYARDSVGGPVEKHLLWGQQTQELIPAITGQVTPVTKN